MCLNSVSSSSNAKWRLHNSVCVCVCVCVWDVCMCVCIGMFVCAEACLCVNMYLCLHVRKFCMHVCGNICVSCT